MDAGTNDEQVFRVWRSEQGEDRRDGRSVPRSQSCRKLLCGAGSVRSQIRC